MRDDNSEIKGLHRSLKVATSRIGTYRGRSLGKGFVASHVWRTPPLQRSDMLLAARDPLTYSFLPNLIWLPSSVAGLTDREGSFAQRYLQALSSKIYRNVQVSEPLRSLATEAWERLPSPSDIPDESLPDLEQINFFEHSGAFVARRRKKIESIGRALRELEEGRIPSGKILHQRYDEAIAAVDVGARRRLAQRLETFL